MILADIDEQRLESFVQPGTRQHDVLQRWVARHGGGAVNSEAAAIRALMQAGADALQDEVLEAGYADLAAIYEDDEARAERHTARDRYVARTDATL